MTRLRQAAPAKINLALHVRRRRADGYHDLETLFAFAEDGDELTAAAADDLTLAIDGSHATGLGTGGDNLVIRAAEALQKRFSVAKGAALRLTKRLPVASGIGGGSADAAATLRLLCRLWGIDRDDPGIAAIAAELGADVPACLLGKPAFGTGRGDELVPFVNPYAGAPMLLVNPGVAVSTARVFAAWDGIDRGPLDPENRESWRNDLAISAISVAPEIADMLAKLESRKGAYIVRMSGSGATCFALFEDEATRDAAAAAFPDCWTLATRLA